MKERPPTYFNRKVGDQFIYRGVVHRVVAIHRQGGEEQCMQGIDLNRSRYPYFSRLTKTCLKMGEPTYCKFWLCSMRLTLTRLLGVVGWRVKRLPNA